MPIWKDKSCCESFPFHVFDFGVWNRRKAIDLFSEYEHISHAYSTHFPRTQRIQISSIFCYRQRNQQRSLRELAAGAICRALEPRIDFKLGLPAPESATLQNEFLLTKYFTPPEDFNQLLSSLPISSAARSFLFDYYADHSRHYCSNLEACLRLIFNPEIEVKVVDIPHELIDSVHPTNGGHRCVPFPPSPRYLISSSSADSQESGDSTIFIGLKTSHTHSELPEIFTKILFRLKNGM